MHQTHCENYWVGAYYEKRRQGPWALLYMYYFSMDLDFEDAVLEVPVEAVVDVPGEEGGVPELSVALGTCEPLPSLLPSSLLLSPCTYSSESADNFFTRFGQIYSEQKANKKISKICLA